MIRSVRLIRPLCPPGPNRPTQSGPRPSTLRPQWSPTLCQNPIVSARTSPNPQSFARAVISQRLVADADGLRRYPAAEILIATSTIREYIRDPEKTVMIRQAIQEGFVQYEMQTFDQSLMQLYKENKISLEDATRASSNPHEFSLRVKGIQGSSDTTWDKFENADSSDEESEFQKI